MTYATLASSKPSDADGGCGASRAGEKSELEHIEKWGNAVKQLYEQLGRAVMAMMEKMGTVAMVEKMGTVGWRETSAGGIIMVERGSSSPAISVEKVREDTSPFEGRRVPLTY